MNTEDLTVQLSTSLESLLTFIVPEVGERLAWGTVGGCRGIPEWSKYLQL